MAIIGSDLFTEGANTALDLHTPTVGATWTLEAPQFQIIATTDRVQHNRNAIDRARKGDAIGDDDMDISADVSVNGASVRIAGVCARMSTDGFANQYEAYLQFLNATTQQVFLFKNVGGVRAQIGNSPQNVTLAQNVQATITLSIRAGTQDVSINGALPIVSATESDSTLSGRQYAGILMNGNNSGNATVDNYVAESVGAAADLAATLSGTSSFLATALTTAILLAATLTGTSSLVGNLTAGPVVVASGGGGARDPLISPNRAPGQSPGYPGLSRLRSMRPRLESFTPVEAPLEAVLTGTGTLTGTLTTAIPLAASLTGTSSLAGDLTAGPELVAVLQSTSSLAGALTTQILLASTLQGTGTLVGSLSTSSPVVLEALLSGTSSMTGTLTEPPSTIPLLAPDRQDTYRPVWFLECDAFLRAAYATRDIDVPTSNIPAPPMQQAYRAILNYPEVTRGTSDPYFGLVEVQDVTVVLANDGEFSGNYAGAPFTLKAYDPESGFLLTTWTGLVAKTTYDIGQMTLEGTNVDLAILDELVPNGTITTAEFPLAAPDAIGKTPPWIFGNVTNLPLLNVRDDQVGSEFDHLLGRDTMAALTGLRRVMPGGANPFSEMSYDELEPYPGMDGVLVNGAMEDWEAGAAVAPTGWTFGGTGTVAKTTTAADVDEGDAAATVVGTGANARLTQDLMLNAPTLGLAWWRGREISIVARGKTITAANAFLRVSDGVATVDTAFHTGGGLYEDFVVGTVAVPFIVNAAATFLSIQLRQVGAGTCHWDHVRIILLARNWAECLRPELYPGYTVIRTLLRQEDASGALFQLAADVHGLQSERNPIRALRTLLTHPTHSAGRTADAASFDAQEAAISLTHEAAALLDGPELFLSLRHTIDSAQTVTFRDRSGHERHGTYDKGAGAPQTMEVPSDPAFSGQSISLRVVVKLPIASLPDTAPYPIVEKLVGATAQSGYMVYRQNNLLVWAVRGVNAVLYSVTSPLVDVTDEGRWIDVVGTASGGVLTLFRDGVLVATGSYTGAIAEGEGVVLVGKFGSGGSGVGNDDYDNIEIVSHALSAGRVAALNAALPLDAEPIFPYDYEMLTVASPTPTFHYRLDDYIGSTIMSDDQGDNGTWVGGPALAVLGPLPLERGVANGGTAARFKNNAAKYGVSTGRTLADAAGALSVFYRPVATKANAGIVEKTIGGVRDTQWGLCQRGAVVRFTLKAANGVNTIDAPVLPEDVDRWNWFRATWSAGTTQLYKNGMLAASGTYTAPLTTGVGDFYVGIQGTAGSGLTRPGRGDIGRVSYHPAAFTAADVARIWTAATWYNGGLYVDAALTEPRPLRLWLEQICQMHGIRLGFTIDGTITVSADVAAPTTIRMHARTGPGDGERTIRTASRSTWPHLDDTVRDVVVRGRRDLLSGEWLAQCRRPVSTRVDAQGRRIGKKKVVELDVAREWPTLDRIAHYLAARYARERTVELELGQEARQLMEGELVQVTDALLGHNGDVMEVARVRKSLLSHGADAQEWDEDRYVWTPEAYPSGATSG